MQNPKIWIRFLCWISCMSLSSFSNSNFPWYEDLESLFTATSCPVTNFPWMDKTRSIEMSQKEKQHLNFLFILFFKRPYYLNLNYLINSSKSPLSELVFLRKVACGHHDRCKAELTLRGSISCSSFCYSSSFCCCSSFRYCSSFRSSKSFKKFWKNLFNGSLHNQFSSSATGWIGYKIGVGSMIAPCALNFLRICLAKWGYLLSVTKKRLRRSFQM